MADQDASIEMSEEVQDSEVATAPEEGVTPTVTVEDTLVESVEDSTTVPDTAVTEGDPEAPPAEEDNVEPCGTADTQPTEASTEDAPENAVEAAEGETADAPQEGDEPKEERVDTAEEGADNATKGSEEGDTTTDEITAPPEGDQESTVAVTGDEKETGEVPKIQTDQADDEGELLLDGHASTLTDIREDDESGAKSAMSSKSAAPPQSEAVTEGERAGSTEDIDLKVSREVTPVSVHLDREDTLPSYLAPDTPLQPGSEGEPAHDEYDDEDEPEFDREQLLERYHAAITDREQLQHQNYQLQHKLADYFKKKKADDNRQDFDKNVTDQEQRYLKYMGQLDDLRRQDSHERDNYKLQIQELKERCEEKQERVDEERQKFMDFKQHVALNAINTRSGKQITAKDIEQYLGAENKKEGDVVVVRLENIKLKNKLKKKEHQLKSKEELAEGLHLIDFEQLKIENQTYNEKIEERNEELLKLRKKITSTVQVLTHLKEKLQYVQAENLVGKGNLHSVEGHVAKERDILTRTKQARDSLRIANTKLRQSSGLLGNEPLLRDFEERKDEGDALKERLENLRMYHAELTLNCNQVRRKIEQAKGTR